MTTGGTDAVASEEAVMDMFAPEFSRFWLPVRERDDHSQDGREVRRDDEARRQQQALEELAERVTAARSIV